jgi:hypothetical protein
MPRRHGSWRVDILVDAIESREVRHDELDQVLDVVLEGGYLHGLAR